MVIMFIQPGLIPLLKSEAPPRCAAASSRSLTPAAIFFPVMKPVVETMLIPASRNFSIASKSGMRPL